MTADFLSNATIGQKIIKNSLVRLSDVYMTVKPK